MATTKVKLDKELVQEANKYADVAGYSSVEEFISHVIKSNKLTRDGIRYFKAPRSRENTKRRS